MGEGAGGGRGEGCGHVEGGEGGRGRGAVEEGRDARVDLFCGWGVEMWSRISYCYVTVRYRASGVSLWCLAVHDAAIDESIILGCLYAKNTAVIMVMDTLGYTARWRGDIFSLTPLNVRTPPSMSVRCIRRGKRIKKHTFH